MSYEIKVYEYEKDRTLKVDVFNSTFIYPVLIDTFSISKEDEESVYVLIDSYKQLGRTNVSWHKV